MLRLPTVRAFLALLTLTVFWGYNWVVMKKTLHYIAAFQFGAIRTVGGAFCLFLLIVLLKKPLSIQHIPRLMVLGLLQTSGFTGLIIWALVEGGAGKTAVLTYTMPFWVMVMAWPVLGEKIQGWQWLAVVFSLAGLLLILDPLHLDSELFSMGLALMAGVSWALAVMLAKRLHQRAPELDLLTLTAWQMLFGSIPIAVAALCVEAPPVQWTPYLIGSLIYNAVICNALAWMLWLYALQRLAAGVASMTSLLAPVIGVLAAWVELGERPPLLESVGMMLIGLALLVISLQSIRQHKPVDPNMGQE